jgi:uncharacterized protein Usg
MARTIPDREASLERQLRGDRLATAEIAYRLPDHPSLRQTFVWQHHDLAPGYPERRRFLAFWAANLKGRLFSGRVGRTERLTPSRHAHIAGVWQLQ